MLSVCGERRVAHRRDEYRKPKPSASFRGSCFLLGVFQQDGGGVDAGSNRMRAGRRAARTAGRRALQ
ncbi:hypothetical protein BSIN_3707 [Burkholderia singularis]|uniref:Uncharacterized protein n=1 Tax=Burkholderia singularis TaxID=1503053 RepID=A0A238H5M2_9BURK|nr:hypothetical protein BSIN_3707 [Burkholderia singularis]